MNKGLTKALTHREFLKICGLAAVGAGASQLVVPPKPALAADETVSGNLYVPGNVGIGITSPNSLLTLSGDANNERLHIKSSITSVVALYTTGGTTGSPIAIASGVSLGYYQLGGYDGSAYYRASWITGYAAENWDSTHRGNSLVFSTTPVASTAITERMRIDSAGNVGIGTVQPDTKLQVTGPVHIDGPLYFLNPGDPYYKMELYSWPGSAAIRVMAWGAVSLATCYGDVLTAAGLNVGIGTQSPAEKLEVLGNIRVNGELKVNGVTAIKSDGVAAQCYYAQ